MIIKHIGVVCDYCKTVISVQPRIWDLDPNEHYCTRCRPAMAISRLILSPDLSRITHLLLDGNYVRAIKEIRRLTACNTRRAERFAEYIADEIQAQLFN